MEVDHDVRGDLGVDLAEVAGRTVLVGVLAQEHDQLPGAEELGVLEEAAVHQHQVVAAAATVGDRLRARSLPVEEAAGVQGHPAAAAAAPLERAARSSARARAPPAMPSTPTWTGGAWSTVATASASASTTWARLTALAIAI